MKSWLLKNILKIIFFVTISQNCFIVNAVSIQFNRTHFARRISENGYFKNKNMPNYRSFQPVPLKHHKVYPRPEDRPDYDMTSYDTEYGGVVSNFTSSIYDDNPPLYPNPEVVAGRSKQVEIQENNRVLDNIQAELPDNSLADGDLKDHNVIDSVTYLYGISGCHSPRSQYIVLLVLSALIPTVLIGGALGWLSWSSFAKEFREKSKLFPMFMNMLCCFEACNIIFIQAAVGVSSPTYCEKIALVLHYTYLVCSVWIILMVISIAEFSEYKTMMALKFNYLLAYGVPAIYVMFNYAISIEQYEIKHYCWMSLEKGMLLGFMAPSMSLILLNTGIVMMGLISVKRIEAQALTAKIQELVDQRAAKWNKDGGEGLVKANSDDTLNNIYTATSSRKNTDSDEALEREMSFEDVCHYVSIPNADLYNEEHTIPIRGVIDSNGAIQVLLMEEMSVRSWHSEGRGLKTYLHVGLVLQPYFGVNWMMGVVAIENAYHWATPLTYLILSSCMYLYLIATLTSVLPILNTECEEEIICEDVPTTPVATNRATDDIPLLDPIIPPATRGTSDTISTISI